MRVVSAPRRLVWLSRRGALAAAIGTCLACGGGSADSDSSSRITVAAASNLTSVFPELGRAFEAKTDIHVVFSFGSTANLAHQIESGAPFDLYAAADVEHVDRLVERGFLVPESRAVYARGRLIVWAPRQDRTHPGSLEDLARPEVQFVALAKPEVAPYGRAAVQALESLGIWKAVQPKVVYAQNVNMAKQFADSGNADLAFTALSLAMGESGRRIEVDPRLHEPIEQALGILRASEHREQARRLAEFILGPSGRSQLARFGYDRVATDRPSP